MVRNVPGCFGWAFAAARTPFRPVDEKMENKNEELLLAFYTGVRMALHAYKIPEPLLGENKAFHLLFRVANGDEPKASTMNFKCDLAERIVDGLVSAGGNSAAH